MALIIALALVLILLIRVAPEKAAARVADRALAKEQSEIEAWERMYLDNGLEQRTLEYVREPNNREELTVMLKDAFKDLEMWKDYEPRFLRSDDRIFFEQRCVDILLARQGKVNSTLSLLGFKQHHVDNLRGKQLTDEYMFLILSYLREEGVDIRIIRCIQYDICHYYFEGSQWQRHHAPLDNKDALRIIEVYENPYFETKT